MLESEEESSIPFVPPAAELFASVLLEADESEIAALEAEVAVLLATVVEVLEAMRIPYPEEEVK